MNFHFDIDKSIAATAFLLKRTANAEHTILPLVKALYLANRESLVHYGRSITGDALCSMKNGPAVSNTYDLMKDSKAANPAHLEKWHHFISARKGDAITLVKEPNMDVLSGREVELLNYSFDVVMSVRGTWSDWSHRFFPEYEDVGNSSRPIDPKKILRLEKVGEEEISEIEEELAELNWLQFAAK